MSGSDNIYDINEDAIDILKDLRKRGWYYFIKFNNGVIGTMDKTENCYRSLKEYDKYFLDLPSGKRYKIKNLLASTKSILEK